jgi:hypothetical protein
MHFDPDPMTPDELGALKRSVLFMQELYELLPELPVQAAPRVDDSRLRLEVLNAAFAVRIEPWCNGVSTSV